MSPMAINSMSSLKVSQIIFGTGANDLIGVRLLLIKLRRSI